MIARAARAVLSGLDPARRRVRVVAISAHPVLALVASGLLAVSATLPWASFDFGYPGAVDMAGAGGHRLYLLTLALGFGLLAVWPERAGRPVQGRRRALVALSLGMAGIAAGNLLTIAVQGGGLGALGVGAWLGVAGGVLGVVCADAVALDTRSGQAWTSLPPPALVALLIGAIGAGLGLVVVGLDVDEGSAFLSYLAGLGAAVVALSALGLVATVSLAAHRFRWVMIIAVGAAAVAFPFTQDGNQEWINLAAQIGVLTAAAVGLNVVVGLAGLLDLGYVAFYGIGAYTAALLSGAVFTTVHVHVPFLLVLLIGAALAGLFGAVLGAPTLRLRGDYLAIVTLGFGEIFTLVVTNWDGLTRGPNGISGIPDLGLPGGFNFGEAHTLFGVELPSFANYYFLALALIGVVAAVFANLNNSRVGRAWIAIREDEVAARAMGVNTRNFKLLAFTIGAVLAGTAGMLNAHVAKSVTPDSYTFLVSVSFLGAVVLGGMGTVPGAIVGMTLLQLIPEKLRFFDDKRLLLFGIALILLMRYRPEGLLASRRRRRELHPEATAAGPDRPPDPYPEGDERGTEVAAGVP